MTATPGRPRSRGLADDRLADLLVAAGCPVCGLRAQASRRYLGIVLREGVTDRASRAELDAAGGYCRRHSRELLAADRAETGGTLGTAILYGSVVRRRVAALDAALAASPRRMRTALIAARRTPACPACAAERSAVERGLARLIELAAEADWAAALGCTEFCLDDLLAVSEVALAAPAARRAALRTILEAQRLRVAAIGRDLDGFAHHSSHDRRHLKTEEETASVERARRLLGGDE